ncbi:hypothetical protein ACFU96_21420 [Streptomyces sp. NPDC057620]|uniref:hypothetical protein n=1 Tax=Streptomyces sp. NPDC057620 TaxID=3346185 RepID=UPI003673FCAC
MPRVTRAHTIRRHLVDGGLLDLELDYAQQETGPDGHDTEGFSLRQQYDEAGMLVVAGAYGPNWLRTLSEISGRLEQPFVKCVVIAEAPGVADHEVMTRWATSAELQARRASAELRQAPIKALLRRQEAEQRATQEREDLEAAGQSGLF